MPAEHARRIILFTDGMQNVAPLVDPIPQGCVGTACNYVINGATQIALNNALGIEIDTIGIDNGGLHTDLLNGVSLKTDGHAYLTTAINDNLREFFVNSLINALRGFSPQLVAYRRATLTNDEVTETETFGVNRSARKIGAETQLACGAALELSGRERRRRPHGPGQDYRRPVLSHLMPSICRPTFAGSSVQAEGDWRMSITGHYAGTGSTKQRR